MLIATLFLLLGCGGKHASNGVSPPSTNPTECPTAQESGAGKIAHEAYLRAHVDQTQTVTVKLRSLPWTNPACSNAQTTAGCPDRDRALAERAALNVKQVQCVLAAFGPAGSVGTQAVWYEPLEQPSSGVPTPIGTAFAVRAVWSQLDIVAQHPYVERIEPAFGQAAKLGVPAPSIPTECPPPNDVPDMKLLDVTSIRGQGRMPVVMELNTALLPTLRSCAGDEAMCDDLVASGWERTVASTRQLTCVRSYVDSKAQAETPDVEYRAIDGILQGPKLPPFGEGIHATLAFGLGLTWEEANEVAKHPYVDRIWTSDALSFGVLPDGCPPAYDTPVELPQCSTATQPTTGKFTPADEGKWRASDVPNEVLIAIRRDQELCPRPACPSRDTVCPERDRYDARIAEETKASQSCVRSLIVSIGGSATDEVLAIGNIVDAMLSWSQIQTVAAHPDVISISDRFGAAPPP